MPMLFLSIKETYDSQDNALNKNVIFLHPTLCSVACFMGGFMTGLNAGTG